MAKGHSLFNIIWQWSMIVDRARRAKQDPERRQKVVRFGVLAIIYGLLTVLCASALLFFRFAGTGFVITVFAVVFAFGIGVVGTLVSLITAVIHWFCQLFVNKRPITWISLALMLVCFVVAALIPVLFF